MMDLELDDTMRRAESELSPEDWEWVDQTVDQMLESLGLDLHKSLGIEDIDLNMELDALFTEFGIDDPDGSITAEYAEQLNKLKEALETNDE